MYRILPLLSLGLLVGLGACTGDDKSTTDDSSGGGDDSSGGGDDSGAVEGITISGSASNLLTGAPATEGLCVVAADPTAAVAGGELTVLATSTVNADGTFSVSGVANTSAVGLLVIVEDCEGEGPTVLPTATGIKKDDYYDLAAGATLSDRSIYSIDATSQAAFQAGLTAAGYTGDLGYEILVPAADALAVLEHEDLVGVDDGRDPLRHDQDGGVRRHRRNAGSQQGREGKEGAAAGNGVERSGGKCGHDQHRPRHLADRHARYLRVEGRVRVEVGHGGQQRVCVPPPGGCSQEFEKCTTASDCCDKTAQCINGHCAQPPPK